MEFTQIQHATCKAVRWLQLIAFADERTLIYSVLFAKLLIAHLQNYGTTLQDCRFQTDNDSEFLSTWNSRDNNAFMKIVQVVKAWFNTRSQRHPHMATDIETFMPRRK